MGELCGMWIISQKTVKKVRIHQGKWAFCSGSSVTWTVNLRLMCGWKLRKFLFHSKALIRTWTRAVSERLRRGEGLGLAVAQASRRHHFPSCCPLGAAAQPWSSHHWWEGSVSTVSLKVIPPLLDLYRDCLAAPQLPASSQQPPQLISVTLLKYPKLYLDSGNIGPLTRYLSSFQIT